MINLLQKFLAISDPDELYTIEKDLPLQPSIHFLSKDKKGRYLGCSDQLAKNLGFNKATDLLGSTDFDFCWASFAPHFKLNDDQVLHNKNASVVMETGKLITGAISKALSYKLPLRLRSNNKIAGVICMSIEVDGKQTPVDKFAAYPLTHRQKACLYYLSKGMTIKQIAKTLALSPRTVEHYLETVKAKLGCYSKAQLIDKILAHRVDIK